MPVPPELDLAAGEDVASPVSRLGNLIIAEALRAHANAIRLQAVNPERGSVEYERDGEWSKAMEVPMPAFGPIISYFKHMAGLRPDREPVQTGQLRVRHEGHGRVLGIRAEVPMTSGERLLITTAA